MTNADKLKEQEMLKLQDEINLEDLIIMGADKKIPIVIEFPGTDGNTVNARVLVKQLTIQELDDFNVTKADDLKQIMQVLEKTVFKHDGTNFTPDELAYLPIGVLKALFEKIFELSGLDMEQQNELMDF